MLVVRPDVVRDAALTVAFWFGYGVGLIRGFTPVLIHRLPLLH